MTTKFATRNFGGAENQKLSVASLIVLLEGILIFDCTLHTKFSGVLSKTLRKAYSMLIETFMSVSCTK